MREIKLTEDNTANRSEHQYQGDPPCNLRIGLVEFLRELRYSQRDGEEVERIPRPGEECDEEKHPLLNVEHPNQREWIRSVGHWRLKG